MPCSNRTRRSPRRCSTGSWCTRVTIGEQSGIQLLGPGDLLVHRGDDVPPQWLDNCAFRAVAPTRLALLGDEFLWLARRVPEVVRALYESAGDQMQRLSGQLVICQLPRVEQRVLAMMWLLARIVGPGDCRRRPVAAGADARNDRRAGRRSPPDGDAGACASSPRRARSSTRTQAGCCWRLRPESDAGPSPDQPIGARASDAVAAPVGAGVGAGPARKCRATPSCAKPSSGCASSTDRRAASAEQLDADPGARAGGQRWSESGSPATPSVGRSPPSS